MVDDGLQFELMQTPTLVGGGGFVNPLWDLSQRLAWGGPHGLPYTHERTLREARHRCGIGYGIRSDVGSEDNTTRS